MDFQWKRLWTIYRRTVDRMIRCRLSREFDLGPFVNGLGKGLLALCGGLPRVRVKPVPGFRVTG